MKHLAFVILCLLINNVLGRHIDRLVVNEKIDRVGSIQSGGAGELISSAYGSQTNDIRVVINHLL